MAFLFSESLQYAKWYFQVKSGWFVSWSGGRYVLLCLPGGAVDSSVFLQIRHIFQKQLEKRK